MLPLRKESNDANDSLSPALMIASSVKPDLSGSGYDCSVTVAQCPDKETEAVTSTFSLPTNCSSPLLLPGITDRRNILSSDEMSTEIGSNSSVDSRCYDPLLGVTAMESEGCQQKDASDRIFDDDETPENRYVRCFHGKRDSAGPQDEDGASQPTTEGTNLLLFIPNMRNARASSSPSLSPSDSDAHSSCPTENSQRSGGLSIPGLINIHESEPLNLSSERVFPWRIKYVPSSADGVPINRECLTDATTADGNPDYEDEDLQSDSEDSAYSESDLRLPSGVFKKVRFLPVQDSAVC